MRNMLDTLSFRVSPEDEYNHPVDDAKNFNESMYINIFDFNQAMGGWFRVGNRPNEGNAEVTCCLYLPDGSVGFIFSRPNISSNESLDAAGLKFEVPEPLKRIRVTYSGPVCLLKNPHEMAKPMKAFAENPIVDCSVALDFHAVGPVFGGEMVNRDGSPFQEPPEEAFAKAHYEQHMSGSGTIRVQEREWKIDGFGLRDHSWGPRYWQNIYWYRWLPMNFGPDLGFMFMIMGKEDGNHQMMGIMLENGLYVPFRDVELQTEWDENYYQTALKVKAGTDDGVHEIEGRVLSLIPLRNRRKNEAGDVLETRITEGMTEYRYRGRVGYGMSEYLDQIIHGEPAGKEKV
ncbi:MAG: hypothetical protein HPY65_14445 [Syntrophaceae bacterium]|nr:hypothetical protein [Syntrophaceae bacterium]